MMSQLERMVEDYGRRVVDASCSIEEIFSDLKTRMSVALSPARATPSGSTKQLEQLRTILVARDVLHAERLESNLVYIGGGSSADDIVESRRSASWVPLRR